MPSNRSRLRLSKWKKLLNIIFFFATIEVFSRFRFQKLISRKMHKKGNRKMCIRHNYQLLRQPNTQLNILLLLFAYLKAVIKPKMYLKDKKYFKSIFLLCGESISSLIQILISQLQASVTGGLSTRQFSLLIFQLEAAEHHESF